MRGGFQRLGINEILWQVDVAKFVTPHLHRIINHVLFGSAAVFLQHLAAVAIGKDRFNARRDITGV